MLFSLSRAITVLHSFTVTIQKIPSFHPGRITESSRTEIQGFSYTLRDDMSLNGLLINSKVRLLPI